MPKPPSNRELRRIARNRFLRARNAERAYQRELSDVSHQVGSFIRAQAPRGQVIDFPALRETLIRYAELIKPWARAITVKMHEEVARRDLTSWIELGRTMGRELRKEIITAPVGMAMRAAMEEQVHLITSLPIEAAERVHKLTTEAIITSSRADEIAKEIMASGHVTLSRAKLIARTEVARTASLLVESRARAVDSEGYYWRTSLDSSVRKEHRRLEGKFIKWSEPPLAGTNGMRYHAGQGPNCFPGNTRVSLGNGIRKLWRVFYEGEIIDIVIASELMTLTPNHPILTTRGWIPARFIDKGDYVICFPEQVSKVTKKNIDHMLPTFEQIFETFIERQSRVDGAAFAFQFYGDAFAGDVDQVAFEPGLPSDLVSTPFEKFGKLSLADAYGWIVLGALRGLAHICGPLFPGLGDQSFAFSSGQLTHAYQHGGASVAPRNAGFFESSGYGCSVHSIFDRESKFAHPGFVSRNNFLNRQRDAIRSAFMRNYNSASPEFLAEDIRIAANRNGRVFESASRLYECRRVSDKAIRNFSGHVFTMETLSGWYDTTVAGVISKNCRCWPEPVIPD